MTNAPCHNCESRAVGCHAACEAYKAYDAGRKAVSQSRFEACLGGTSAKRNHERWLDQQKRRAK